MGKVCSSVYVNLYFNEDCTQLREMLFMCTKIDPRHTLAVHVREYLF